VGVAEGNILKLGIFSLNLYLDFGLVAYFFSFYFP